MPTTQPIKMALFGAGIRGEMDLGHFVRMLHKEMRFSAVAESDPVRRNRFVREFGIDHQCAFGDWKDLLAGPKVADAVLNCLPCNLHHASTVAALRAGYPVLLEKPIAHTPGECVHLAEVARREGHLLAVVLENRYNAIYQKTKTLLDAALVGDIQAVSCEENLGYYHYTNSYVRGLHHSSAGGNSLMIAKGIHDLDLILWLLNVTPKRVASFGGLSYFHNGNAPKGAPERCIEGCPVQQECMFDAVKHYLKPGRPQIPFSLIKGQAFRDYWDILRYKRFRSFASAIVRDVTKENVMHALRESPFGRCVFRSDNDVADHQATTIEFNGGVTCSFSMSGLSMLWERILDITGSRGVILSRDFTGRLECSTYNPPRARKYRIRYDGLHHGGGDKLLLQAFARAVRRNEPSEISTRIDTCVEGHLLALAAEAARVTGSIIDMATFRENACEAARALK